jgi:glycosyltransferase involved in cell wall biosynthesis
VITVITATLPERADLLERAVASVALQTLRPEAHLVGVDHRRRGGAAMKNLLAYAADTEWLAILDDDDHLYPDHLLKLLAASGDADVVYSWCDSTGDSFTAYNQGWEGVDALRGSSRVSHNAIVRTSLFKAVGGFPLERGYDWLFWIKAAEAGARFVCVPERTWFYDLDPQRWHESR